jgi:hypothetical protein
MYLGTYLSNNNYTHNNSQNKPGLEYYFKAHTGYHLMNSNNLRLGVYAATHIKFKHQETLAVETGKYITARFKKHFPQLERSIINTTLTSKISGMGMNYITTCNATSTFEHSWRIKTISQHLPTMLKSHTIFLNSTTPRCSIFPETQHHIWSCALTVQSFPDLCRSTAELISVKD